METTSGQASVVHWLSQPATYLHRPERVEHLETHISHVFLAGPYVYKLKKPVRFDFLDFSTVAARAQACREELRLNRRLAPGTYLRVVPIIRDQAGGYCWDSAGDVVDWVVEMRRLPTELTLDALHKHGQLQPVDIARLVTTLANFYRALPSLALSPQKYCERYLAHVRANRRELLAVNHHLRREVVKRVHGFQLQVLILQPEIFKDRVRAGRIVDGHGDLRPEHICLSDPIAIFDCIEFSPDFRRLDVADELAFLAAECDFIGAEWVGPRLLAEYHQYSGDQPPAVLLDFYKSYRACVRAKVAALRADQLQGDTQLAAAADARKHLGLADQYSAPWLQPLVITVGGLAGTGKTTLATALAEALGAELLSTDILRQDLFPSDRQPAEIDRGIYSREAREQVYTELFCRGVALHADRIPIVLDGTFSTLESLVRARQLAADRPGSFLAVECVCRPILAHGRIAQRLAAGRDASDARPEIHDLQQLRWEPWPADVPQIRVDTEQPLSKQVELVIAALASVLASNSLDCSRRRSGEEQQISDLAIVQDHM